MLMLKLTAIVLPAALATPALATTFGGPRYLHKTMLSN